LAALKGKRYALTDVNEGADSPVIEQTASAAESRALDDRAKLRALLSKQLRNFTALFARALAEENPDTVHDLRVCTRRLQQILAAMAAPKDAGKLRSIRRTLRRVRRALGQWRNCDVVLEMVTRNRRRAKAVRRRGWELVERSVRAQRERAVQKARRRLYKSGGITLNQRIQQLLELHSQRLGGADPSAAVRAAVAQSANQWREALERARADRSVANIHALRIQGKRLRYRLELARDLGAAQAPQFIKWFKLLQDRLGLWHDREELGRFIARAIAQSDVMLEEPRTAIELLKQVESGIRSSSRELDELFRLAGESESSREFEQWLARYVSAAPAESASMRPDQPADAPAQTVDDHNPDGKAQN
jgi:CHAD domain-containing protein